MPLASVVISTVVSMLNQTVAKTSKPAAQALIAAVIEYGPKAQAQAKIMREVAKMAPWAVGLISSAIAFAIASVGFRKNTRISIGARSFGIHLESGDHPAAIKVRPKRLKKAQVIELEANPVSKKRVRKPARPKALPKKL